MVHGDDFITVGRREDLRCFKGRLKGRFDIKDTTIGGAAGEEKELKVLNRVIRWTVEGWEYEADQRHAELIVEGMGMQDSKTVICLRRGREQVGIGGELGLVGGRAGNQV